MVEQKQVGHLYQSTLLQLGVGHPRLNSALPLLMYTYHQIHLHKFERLLNPLNLHCKYEHHLKIRQMLHCLRNFRYNIHHFGPACLQYPLKFHLSRTSFLNLFQLPNKDAIPLKKPDQPDNWMNGRGFRHLHRRNRASDHSLE